MKNLKKIIIVILKIIAFLFCFLIVKSIFGLFYWRMTHLSAEDLAWVKTIAQKTSHDRFVSDTASPLKLTIKDMDIQNDGNPFYISSAGGDVYEANAGYSYVLTGNGREIEGWLRIVRTIKSDTLSFDIYLHHFGTKTSFNDYIPLIPRKMEIRGKMFDDCICSDSIHWKNYSRSGKEDSITVDKLIVSKKYGLIYFRYTDGTEYYRDFQ